MPRTITRQTFRKASGFRTFGRRSHNSSAFLKKSLAERGPLLGGIHRQEAAMDPMKFHSEFDTWL